MKTIMKEIWKPVVGYEGLYEVSNLGRVKSLDRIVTVRRKDGTSFQRPHKGQMIRIQKCSNGYRHVPLCKDGRSLIARVHRVVAEAFIDNPEGLPEVNHIDEDKTNNRADNLEWCTHQYNNSYGTKPLFGERNPMSKITADEVKEIRIRRASGEMLKDIAADYGISINHVCNIAQGKRWGHEASTRG